MMDLKPAKSGHVKADDIQLYYEIYGAGDPLVLIAGTGSSCANWRIFQVPEFSKHYEVLIYDHRGMGRSDKPDMKYSTRLFAKDCAQLMDALGIPRAHIMGQSMGGRVAQWLALDYPEKVRSLVLSAAGSGNFAPGVNRTRGIPLNTALEMIEKGYEGYMRDHWEGRFMFTDDFVRERPEVIKRFQGAVLEDLPPLKCYLRHVIARQEHETTELLPRINAPTLVIYGAEDTVTDEGGSYHTASSKVLSERIPNTETVAISGAAHGYLRQSPEKAHPPILDFLRRH
ncbi:MAG: alpha/beta fold hydrolase [Candidatus Binatia bacterium]